MARVVRGLWILVGVCALLAVSVFVANRLSRSSANAATSRTVADIADVSMDNYLFIPSTVTITVGSTVRWTHNQSSPLGVPHTTTSDTGLWDSGSMSFGNVYTYTFNSPGVYAYHCFFHGAFGMTGTVVVMGNVYLPVVLSGA
jgi:plastocyanin